MGRRTAIPLHRARQATLIHTLDPRENRVGPHEGMTTHLMLGSGVRNDTCGHVHEDWFSYIEGELILQVPSAEPCRKYTRDGDLCGECKDEGRYTPKTPKGAGRQILIGNEYHNYTTGETEYFGLKDRIERYFALSDPDAPPEARHGFEMIQADGSDGFSANTANKYVRSVCAKAGISKDQRANRLEAGLPEPDDDDKAAADKIRDFGTDDAGRDIPDMIAHDMRATFCTQLCRDPDPNYTRIRGQTGHKNEETLYRYVGFAGEELDVEEDKSLF